MTISISIHVDGYYGLVKGVPNMLKLFKKYGIKVSFFINMGNEATIFELIKYRRHKLDNKDKAIVNRYSKIDLLRMVLFPKKLGHGNCKIIREIIKEGHEVNPHAWSHLRWSKNFENIDHNMEIKKMKNSFYRCIGKYPRGFAPPTWKINDNILDILKENNFEYVGLDKGKFVKKRGIFIIPLSFGKNIEELLNGGLNRSEILKTYKKELNKKYVNLYFHADFEGIKGLKIFEEVLKMIDPKKVITYKELLKNK